MIAVAKGLLGGLETAVASTTKKDGDTPPFADTFQQAAATRADQVNQAATQLLEKTDRTGPGGKKTNDPSAGNAAKQTAGQGSALVSKADASSKNTIAADTTEEPAETEISAPVGIVVSPLADRSTGSRVAVVEEGSVPSSAVPLDKEEVAQIIDKAVVGSTLGIADEGTAEQPGARTMDGLVPSADTAVGNSVALPSRLGLQQVGEEGLNSAVSSGRNVSVSSQAEQATASLGQGDAEIEAGVSQALREQSQNTVSAATGSSKLSGQTSTPHLVASLVKEGHATSVAVPMRTGRASSPSASVQAPKTTSSAAVANTTAEPAAEDALNVGEISASTSQIADSSGDLAVADRSVQLIPQVPSARVEPNESVNLQTPYLVGPIPSSSSLASGHIHPRVSSTKTTETRKTAEVANKQEVGTQVKVSVAAGAPGAGPISPAVDATGTLAPSAVSPNAASFSADAAVSDVASSRARGSDTSEAKSATLSGSHAESVTPLVTGSGSAVKVLTTIGQGSATVAASQRLEEETGTDTSYESVDPVPSATNFKEAVVGGYGPLSQETIVTAAKSLVKAGQQRGLAEGSAPIAKERKGAAVEAASTAGGGSSVPVGSGHGAALAGPSMTASDSGKLDVNEHQQFAAGGTQSPAVPGGNVESASLTAQSQVAPASGSIAHAAAPMGAAPVGADNSALAMSPASQIMSRGTDQALLPMAHTTLSATPTVLEVGVPSGTQGWLKIRAEIGEGGVVQASMSASTHAGQDALRRDLPAISAFLDNEHVPVNLQVMHSNSTSFGSLENANSSDSNPGSSLGQSLSQNASSSGGSGQGEADAGMFAGGSGSGQSSGQQQEPTGRVADVRATASVRDAGVALPDWGASAGYGGGSDAKGGSWLNVVA